MTTAPIIIEPKIDAKSAVIWLHGLGADAHDFEGIVPFLPIEKCAIRMIFPNAPKRPVTINGGLSMPAWYDISDLALRNQDKLGIAESTETIYTLIEQQITMGVPSEKIVIAGFSQGGAMALHASLRTQNRLAGVIALSCYLLERERHAAEVSPSNQQTPIWMGHGTQDPIVSYELGKSSADFLLNHGHKITFLQYAMGHEVSTSEITALSQWLEEVLH